VLPAFSGEEGEIKTRVEDVQRVRSLGRDEFVREADGKVLMKRKTDCGFVDAKTGAPRAIPEEEYRVFAVKQEK
jgi:acyl-CoA thioesterase FadM